MHWHRPGQDLERVSKNELTACRAWHVQDVPHHHTVDYWRVTCAMCVALLPDHLAEIRDIEMMRRTNDGTEQ